VNERDYVVVWVAVAIIFFAAVVGAWVLVSVLVLGGRQIRDAWRQRR
jgi:hypothetical protein